MLDSTVVAVRTTSSQIGWIVPTTALLPRLDMVAIDSLLGASWTADLADPLISFQNDQSNSFPRGCLVRTFPFRLVTPIRVLRDREASFQQLATSLFVVSLFEEGHDAKLGSCSCQNTTFSTCAGIRIHDRSIGTSVASTWLDASVRWIGLDSVLAEMP